MNNEERKERLFSNFAKWQDVESKADLAIADGKMYLELSNGLLKSLSEIRSKARQMQKVYLTTLNHIP